MLTVTIKKDANGEYRVPSPDGTEAGAAYTDDYDDAVGTARDMYARAGHSEINVKLRKINRYHGEEE